MLTPHFMASSQKSMKVTFFQGFVDYNRPTWNKIVRHTVRLLWAPGFRSSTDTIIRKWRVSDSSTRKSEHWFPVSWPSVSDGKMISPCRTRRLKTSLPAENRRKSGNNSPYRYTRDVPTSFPGSLILSPPDVQLPMLALKLLAMSVANSLMIISCQSRQLSVFLNWRSVL